MVWDKTILYCVYVNIQLKKAVAVKDRANIETGSDCQSVTVRDRNITVLNSCRQQDSQRQQQRQGICTPWGEQKKISTIASPACATTELSHYLC